jgi:predicted nuclease of restriction endonuclease-like (RecB) superfamily
MLAERLTREFGRGFFKPALLHSVRLAEVFPDEKIVSTLWRQLGWSHFREIIYLKDPLQRDFYAEMCRIERWNVRTLRDRIRSMLFERTALSRKPAELARRELAQLRAEDRLTPDLVFRDPYILDFLGLPEAASEKDLEAAVLREMERVLLELGGDFAFVARQKRMTIGTRDFHLDLLFFHRGLRALVAVDLKLGEFSAEHKGQMELYLRWLDRHERRAGEGTPLGLILCAEAETAQVELLELDRGAIRVGEYLTALPPRSVLAARLREALRRGREAAAGRADHRNPPEPARSPRRRTSAM